MPQLFTNNAWSTLPEQLANTANTLTVVTGTGDRFPTITGIDYFLITLIEITNDLETNWEIAKCVGRANDIFTIERAQENTIALTWPIDTRIELRLTAGAIISRHDIGVSGERRHEFASPYIYCGTAPIHTLDSATIWTLTRITSNANGAITNTAIAVDSWDNRSTTIYT